MVKKRGTSIKIKNKCATMNLLNAKECCFILRRKKTAKENTNKMVK